MTGTLIDAYEGIVCDLDGVVYRGRDAVPHAVEALDGARRAGVRIAYATNNASRPPQEVRGQLTDLGLDLAAEGKGDDQLGRTQLGKVLCDAQSLALLGLRSTLRSLAGAQPGAESSIAKLIGVDHSQDVWETAVGWLGADAMSQDPGERGQARSPLAMFLSSRCLSIAGGTTDVQLNIIGERLLGLPRDPEPGA